jgi:hypothetical protein
MNVSYERDEYWEGFLGLLPRRCHFLAHASGKLRALLVLLEVPLDFFGRYRPAVLFLQPLLRCFKDPIAMGHETDPPEIIP